MENIKSSSSPEETPSGVITFGDEDPKLIRLREEFLFLKEKVIRAHQSLSMVNEHLDSIEKLERKNKEMKIQYEKKMKNQENVSTTKIIMLNEQIKELEKKINKNGSKKNQSEIEILASQIIEKDNEIKRLNRQITNIKNNNDEKIITMEAEIQAYQNNIKKYERDKVELTKDNEVLRNELENNSTLNNEKKKTIKTRRGKNKSICLDSNLSDGSDIKLPNNNDIKLSPKEDYNNLSTLPLITSDLDEEKPLLDIPKILITFPSNFTADLPIKCDQSTMTDELINNTINKSLFIEDDVDNNFSSLPLITTTNDDKQSVDSSITIPSNLTTDLQIKCEIIKSDQSTMTDELIITNNSLFNNREIKPTKFDQSTMTDELINTNNSLLDEEPIKPTKSDQTTMTDELISINNSLLDEEPIKPTKSDQTTMTDELVNTNEQTTFKKCDQSTMTDELINNNINNSLFGDDDDDDDVSSLSSTDSANIPNNSTIESPTKAHKNKPVKNNSSTMTDELIINNKNSLLFGDDDDDDDDDNSFSSLPSIATTNLTKDKQPTDSPNIPSNSTIDPPIEAHENKPQKCNQSTMTDETNNNSKNNVYPLFCNKCEASLGTSAVDKIITTMKIMPPPLIPEFSMSPVKSKSSNNTVINSNSSVITKNINSNETINPKRIDDIERRLKICEESRAAPLVDHNHLDVITQYLAKVINIAASQRTEESMSSSSTYCKKRKIDELEKQKISRKRRLNSNNFNNDDFDNSLRLSESIDDNYEEDNHCDDFNNSIINNNVSHYDDSPSQISKNITKKTTITAVQIHETSENNGNNLNGSTIQNQRAGKRKNSVQQDDIQQSPKKLIITKKQGNILKKCNNLKKNSSRMVPIVLQKNKNTELIETKVIIDEPSEPDLPCKKKIRKAHTPKGNVIEDKQIIHENKIQDEPPIKKTFEKRVTRSVNQNVIQNNNNENIKSVEKIFVKSVDNNEENKVNKNLEIMLNDKSNNDDKKIDEKSQLNKPDTKDVEKKIILESETEAKTEKSNEENNKPCDSNLTLEEVVKDKTEVKNINETNKKDTMEKINEKNKQELDKANENKEIDNNNLQVSEEIIKSIDIPSCSTENLDDKINSSKVLDTNNSQVKPVKNEYKKIVNDLDMADSESELEINSPSRNLDDKKNILKILDKNNLEIKSNENKITNDIDMSDSEGELEIALSPNDSSDPPIEENIIFEQPKTPENLSTSPKKKLHSSAKKLKSPIKPPSEPCTRELRNRRVSTSLNEPTSTSLNSKKTIQCYLDEYLQKNNDNTKKLKPLLKSGSLQIATTYKEKFENKIKNELNMLLNNPEWNKNIQETVIENLVDINNQKLVAKCIVELLNDTSIVEDELNKNYTPPAPLMTVKEQKIISLIVYSENKMPDIYSWIYKTIEKFLFTLNNNKLNNTSSLSRIYVVLSKIKKDRERVRIMCCDALYFLKLNGLHVIYSVITSWPEALPFYDSNKEQYLMRSIAHIITSDSRDNTNVIQVKKMIKDYYKYPCKSDDPLSTNITNILINAFILKPNIQIKTAIILLAKKEDTNWTFKNIIPRLIDIICDKKNTHIIGDAIKLIGSLLRSFPWPDDGTVGKYIDQLRYLIDVGPTSPDIQESLISALLSLTRFRFDDIARTVISWEPSGGILSPILQEQFDAFFKTRNADFWIKIKSKNQKFSKIKHFLPACTNLIDALQLK